MLISALQHNSKLNFELLGKKLGFLVVGLVKTFPLMYQLLNVGLIVTKSRRFQLYGPSQNSISNLKKKKNQIFGFPCCRTREDLSIDVFITNVGLILKKPG